jgi:hypothetical protein
LDYILDRLSKFNDYSLVEEAYSVMFYVAGLSLSDVSEILLGRVLENGSIGSQGYSLWGGGLGIL